MLINVFKTWFHLGSTKVKGFTIIELLVSTTIIGILLSAAAPSLNLLFDRFHARYALSSLRDAFTHARTLALKSGASITVCPMQTTQCGHDWDQPLAIFMDLNQNLRLDPNETLHVSISNQITHGYWQKKKSKNNYIRFNPLGHAFSSATSFVYCPNSGRNDYAKQLVISFQGRIRTNHYLSSRGTPYAALAPLSCP
jgi:prepilin-type N-terminal cleavage/methylation domain